MPAGDVMAEGSANRVGHIGASSMKEEQAVVYLVDDNVSVRDDIGSLEVVGCNSQETNLEIASPLTKLSNPFRASSVQTQVGTLVSQASAKTVEST